MTEAEQIVYDFVIECKKLRPKVENKAITLEQDSTRYKTYTFKDGSRLRLLDGTHTGNNIVQCVY